MAVPPYFPSLNSGTAGHLSLKEQSLAIKLIQKESLLKASIFPYIPLMWLRKERYQLRHVQACTLSHFSRVQFFAILWTIAHQAPLSRNSPGKNTGVSNCFLLQRIFPTQGLNLGLPHWRADALPSEPPGKSPGGLAKSDCWTPSYPEGSDSVVWGTALEFAFLVHS